MPKVRSRSGKVTHYSYSKKGKAAAKKARKRVRSKKRK